MLETALTTRPPLTADPRVQLGGPSRHRSQETCETSRSSGSTFPRDFPVRFECVADRLEIVSRGLTRRVRVCSELLLWRITCHVIRIRLSVSVSDSVNSHMLTCANVNESVRSQRSSFCRLSSSLPQVAIHFARRLQRYVKQRAAFLKFLNTLKQSNTQLFDAQLSTKYVPKFTFN